jgi:hypothetical protein
VHRPGQCLRLAALATCFGRPVGIFGEIAASTALSTFAPLSTLLFVLEVLGALLPAALTAALLAAIHVVILVALLSSALVLLAASTLIGHFVSPVSASRSEPQRRFGRLVPSS